MQKFFIVQYIENFLVIKMLQTCVRFKKQIAVSQAYRETENYFICEKLLDTLDSQSTKNS